MGARIRLPRQLTAGPFSVGTGLASGLGAGRLRGPDLVAPFHGVRVDGAVFATLATDLRILAHAQQARMPEHAFFCGATAAILWGLPLPHHHERSSALHVGVPAPRRAPAGRGVIGHKLLIEPQDVVEHRGLRLTSPERTWCDLGPALPLFPLVAVGDALIHWRNPLTTRDRLADAVLRFPGRRGQPNLRQALPLLDEGSESPRETQLRVIAALGNVVGIVANLSIRTSSGHRYRGDLVIPGRKVILEYQSEYHFEAAQARRDMTRRSRLEADGWFVMYINSDDLGDHAELVARIRTVLASRPTFM